MRINIVYNEPEIVCAVSGKKVDYAVEIPISIPHPNGSFDGLLKMNGCFVSEEAMRGALRIIDSLKGVSSPASLLVEANRFPQTVNCTESVPVENFNQTVQPMPETYQPQHGETKKDEEPVPLKKKQNGSNSFLDFENQDHIKRFISEFQAMVKNPPDETSKGEKVLNESTIKTCLAKHKILFKDPKAVMGPILVKLLGMEMIRASTLIEICDLKFSETE